MTRKLALVGKNERPAGATLLALALGWFAIAGFGNALVWRRLPHGGDVPVSPRLSAAVDALQPPVLSALALICGITACIASIGVWRLRPWKARAFLAWSTSVIVLVTWFVFALPTVLLAGGRGVGTAFVLLLAAMLAVMYFYVARLPPNRGRSSIGL
jgi:hypothetical protein